MRKILLSFLSAIIPAMALAWQGNGWTGTVNADGTVSKIVFDKGVTVPFFATDASKGISAGPSFYINTGGKDTIAAWRQEGADTWTATLQEVSCTLQYINGEQPTMKVTMRNDGHTPFQPVKAGLKTGIDTYMDKYPQWMGKYFPTLMYCERTHFYGYIESPGGSMVAIASPNPIASWSVDYNLGYQSPAPHWFMGHRILSLNLDLLNAIPLPDHNPQNMWQLLPGEAKTWTISLFPVTAGSMEAGIHRVADIPMLRMERTNYDVGDTALVRIYADNPKVTVAGNEGLASIVKGQNGEKLVKIPLTRQGLYKILLADGDKVAQGIVQAHPTWQWCLERAREATLRYHQKATSHAESWYGFYSAFIAARYFPNEELDKKVTARFEKLFAMLHDTVAMKPLYHIGRIQNTSSTIGLLTMKYQASHDIHDLDRAARLADWLISFSQAKDGAYMWGKTVYTSVIYIAKSLMELYAEEQKLGRTDKAWNKRANRHYASVKRAIDQLVAAQGDFQTEGEMTFEDGMLSCSALQIGQFALLQKNAKTRKHYTDAMLDILQSHDCLAQLRVNDARRRGGTLRFWEAQYDVMMLPNMFNSPHGWSGWRGYATYYAYLLTGNRRWLDETYNAMGAFSRLLADDGTLRWAFVVDPYLHVRQTSEPDQKYTADSLSFSNHHPDLYPTRKFTIGEQYVNMVSDWQGVNTQDNDVHEVFKCIGEAVLTNAFVVEDESGRVYGYNCKVSRSGDVITVKPDEPQVTHLHCNLRHAATVSFNGKSHRLPKAYLGFLE